LKLPLRSGLLSLASPKRLKLIGLWMIIAGLIGDAGIIAFIPSGTIEKILSALSSLVIALGVWVEEVGADAINAPRELDDKQAQEIIAKISAFPGTPFAIDADPAAEYAFVNRLIEVLQRAGWRWQSYSTSLCTLPVGDISALPLGTIGIQHADGSGVQLRINRDSTVLMEPAHALAFALTNAFQASVSMAIDSKGARSADAVHVEIRRKL
jgi:hypothetical protein